MNNAPEEFEKLQTLLKLKRYEQPPPGYFNNFSDRVINGIERHGNDAMSQLRWMSRLLNLLETNPFAAGVFGVSVCGLLISGIAWSQSRIPVETMAGNGSTMAVADNSSATPAWSKAQNVDSLAPSLTPVFMTNASSGLFSGMSSISAEPVNFSVGH